jgi:excisionase family DNA binding protein
MPRRADAELTEIGRLFLAKLRQLREEEGGRVRRSTVPRRRRVGFDAVELPPSDAEMLSPSDLAHLLGVHPKTVARWATHGDLPSFRTMGGHRRYRWGDVRAWIETP